MILLKQINHLFTLFVEMYVLGEHVFHLLSNIFIFEIPDILSLPNNCQQSGSYPFTVFI